MAGGTKNANSTYPKNITLNDTYILGNINRTSREKHESLQYLLSCCSAIVLYGIFLLLLGGARFLGVVFALVMLLRLFGGVEGHPASLTIHLRVDLCRRCRPIART